MIILGWDRPGTPGGPQQDFGMTALRVPLGVLDLVPVVSGSDPNKALGNALDLVQVAEQLGYRRYWFAEHHLNPGVAGSAPALLIAMAGAQTEHIRLGSGGVQSGHRTALSIVEDFGLLDAMYPGRIDLGIGRSGGRTFFREKLIRVENGAAKNTEGGDKAPPRGPPYRERVADSAGAVAPAPGVRPQDHPHRRDAATADAKSPQYAELVEDILGLVDGSYRSTAVWIRARPRSGCAGRALDSRLESRRERSRGRPSGSSVRSQLSHQSRKCSERGACIPGGLCSVQLLERPYVAVSADVVVAPDDETARYLAAGYAHWVRSIRCGEGAIPFPAPEEAAHHPWTPEDEALVHDRVASQFVGSPATVVQGLERLQEAARADEIIVTTITHSHHDRVRSFALLAHEWGLRSDLGTDSAVRPSLPKRG